MLQSTKTTDSLKTDKFFPAHTRIMGSTADRWRNLGPSDLQPLELGVGRHADMSKDLRPIFVSLGVTRNANGSAYLEVGNTKIQCSVHGPVPFRGPFRPTAQLGVSVQVEPFAGVENAFELESSVAEFVKCSLSPAILLDQYFKSAINIDIIFLTTTNCLTSNLASAVNVACLALVNAGIAMRDMVTAVNSCIVNGDVYGDVDVDPKEKQLVASFATAEKKLTGFLINSEGPIKKSEIKDMLSCAEKLAVLLRKVCNGYLLEDYMDIFDLSAPNEKNEVAAGRQNLT